MLAREQRRVVMLKATVIIDSAMGRELTAAEVLLLEQLTAEAELLDDRALRWERVEGEERDSTMEAR
jgi:hypothetical protein